MIVDGGFKSVNVGVTSYLPTALAQRVSDDRDNLTHAQKKSENEAGEGAIKGKTRKRKKQMRGIFPHLEL